MGISEDATNTPAVKYTGGSTSATQTTASFSPQAGTLVVVLVNVGYNTANATGPTVTVADSLSNSYAAGPTVYSTRADYTGIFTRYYASAPGSITVTATRNLTAAAGFQVAARCGLGADPAQAGAASATYSRPYSSENKSATGAITTTVTGSLVYLCVTENQQQAQTAYSGTTTILATSDSGDSEELVTGKATSLTGTPGSTTLGWTFGTNSTWSLSMLEVVPVPLPKISTLTDTFGGTVLNPALWWSYPDGLSGSVAVSNGLSLTDTASVANSDYIQSSSLYDLTNSFIYVQLVSAGTQGPVTQAILQVNSGAYSLNILVGGGNLIVQDELNSVWTQKAHVAYDSSAMQWLRIRESAGTVYYEYAATLAGTWTTLYSEADPFPLTALNVAIQQSAWSTGDPAATSQWANLNILIVVPLAAAAAFPAPVVTAWPITPATVTVTSSIPAPAVSPPQIFHVGDSALYTSSDISPVVGYNNTPGNTMVAYITAYTTGNNPAQCNGVFDDVGNTWTITVGGGSYDATTGLYGFTAIACCVGALAMNYITVYFNQNNNYILYRSSSSVQISEFAGLPAGSTPAAVATSSPDVSTASYTAPAVTVAAAGAYLILSAVASSGTWTGLSAGTLIDSAQASWNIVTAAGSYSPTCTGSAQTVYGAVTVTLGFATPMTTALFTPAGTWMGANGTSLPAQFQAAGNLVIVKVSNTSDSTVYCTGLTSSNATWVPAGTPFFGTINAMTAAAFAGTVTTAGADTIVPTWSGATPASWTMAGHEFFAASGWRFDAQAGLDSAGTNTWTPITPNGPGELYFGHATASIPSAGSTPGYVYNINIGGSGSSAAYNSAAT